MLTRLQRFLADCGVASRRECEEMILAGRVSVNGEVRIKMPVMIDAGKDVITVDDERVGAGKGRGTGALQEQKKVYFLLNKPKGILVTNSDPGGRKTVNELMTGVKERVFPVGRLDMDSRGVLVMTNDGELANRLTHPRFGVEKTYVVEVDGRVGHGEIEKMKRGIWLGPARPGGAAQGAEKSEKLRVKLIGRERGRTILELTMSEGRNQEIRRVMAGLGHTVRDLNRVAIGGKVTLKGLDVGEYRPLTEAEVKWLYHASSPEFHNRERAETQQWYEEKEMEKERKRLAREAAEPPTPVKIEAPKPKVEKPERVRPERKGKKPFVPPTGRNAGKALGGNYIGKRRQQKELTNLQDEIDIPITPPSDLPSHPLGFEASGDE